MASQKRCHQLVKLAVQTGELPPPTKSFCYDCVAPATEYDHRDYAKPYDVEPVCRPCNSKRGSAKNNDRPYHNGIEGKGYSQLWKSDHKESVGTGIERAPSDLIDEYWTSWEPDRDIEKLQQEWLLTKRLNAAYRRRQRSVVPGPTKSFLRGLHDWFGINPI
jgi:hypothetical protein